MMAIVLTVVLVIVAFYAGVLYAGRSNANRISELENYKATAIPTKTVYRILHESLEPPNRRKSKFVDIWNGAIFQVEQSITDAMKMPD